MDPHATQAATCPPGRRRRWPGAVGRGPAPAARARTSAGSSARHCPGREAAVGERADPGAHQAAHGVAHGLAHAPDLAVAALVDDDAQHPGGDHAHRGRRGHAVVEVDALAQAAQGPGRGRRPPPRPGTPSRPRTTGWVRRWARSPSLVRTSRPSLSASSRPTGNTRGSSGTSSTTVGRPWGSSAVVTTPTGLLSR